MATLCETSIPIDHIRLGNRDGVHPGHRGATGAELQEPILHKFTCGHDAGVPNTHGRCIGDHHTMGISPPP